MYTKVVLLAFLGAAIADSHPDLIDGPDCMPNFSKIEEERECCNMQIFHVEKLKNSMMECMKELNIQPPNRDGGKPKPPQHNPCKDECIFKKNSLLNGESKIDEEKLKAFYKESFTSTPEWEEAGIAAISTCVPQALEGVDEKEECKSGSAQFHRCFIRQSFLNCPAKFWKENDVCNALKERLTKCSHAMPPPPAKKFSKH